jgi:dTMP kinase
MNGPLKLAHPLFIVFEGIDGSGKSTLADMIVSYLTSTGMSVTKSSEPTRGTTGIRLRSLLQSPLTPDPDLMLGLFIEDREEDVAHNIQPALARGDIVVLDRYYYSNAAYQGASGLSYRRIMQANTARSFPTPDRVYLLDLKAEDAVARISKRNKETGIADEMFERVSFLDNVRRIYNEIADDRFMKLDATMPPEKLLILAIEDLERSFPDA